MSSQLSDEKYHFVTLCRYFLDALNPRPEDYVMCLDCILGISDNLLPKYRSEFRDQTYHFVGHFYKRDTVTDEFRSTTLAAYINLFKDGWGETE